MHHVPGHWLIADGGRWAAVDGDAVLIGSSLAVRLHLQPGDSVQVAGREFPVSGILETGGPEEDKIVASLDVAQELASLPGAVKSIYVSALTKPEDAFARRDPYSLSPADRDRWYCSPYANAIAFQMEEAIPHAKAEQIRQVAQNEGTVLSRIAGLMPRHDSVLAHLSQSERATSRSGRCDCSCCRRCRARRRGRW